MKTQFIDKSWVFSEYGKNEALTATVPGSVYSDMLDHKLIDDPFWRDNENDILKLSDNDYVYTCNFTPDSEILKEETVLLHFDGLDTLADVFLNGKLLGSADNMHRMWEYDVKQILTDGVNELRIHFHSPTKYIAEAYENDVIYGSSHAMRGFGHLRKASYMFGWDWGPRLPDMGIWKPVKLIGYSNARLDGVYITQKHSEKKVDLNFEISIQRELQSIELLSENDSALKPQIIIKNPLGETIVKTDSFNVTIEAPELWWPNGIGSQPLYEICVTLLSDGGVLDTWCKKIGLRTVTMHIEKDEYGECFAHCVNGKDIFALGADYIPEDNILSRMTPRKDQRAFAAGKERKL